MVSDHTCNNPVSGKGDSAGKKLPEILRGCSGKIRKKDEPEFGIHNKPMHI